jgi:hypothetical protein
MSEGTNSRIGTSRKVMRVVNMSTIGNAPVVNDKANPSEDFVRCGRQNLFREFLRGLADNVAPLNSVVNTMALYIAGRRLVFKDRNGEEIERATEVWNALHAEEGEAYFRRAVAKDLALLGDRAFELSINALGQPAALYHLDAMRLRIGKKDGKGKINQFKWCSNWELTNKYSKDYPIQTLPAFNLKGEAFREKGKGVMFAKDYHQGQDYYGMPWYMSALTDAEVWARIPVFNRTQIDTGFRPAFHIHVFLNSDDQKIEEIDGYIEEVFTGPDGKTYAVTHGTTAEGAPQITKLERGDHAGELDKMGDRAEQVLYKSCGIPPILMGVEVNTGMSGKGLALDQSVTQFMRTQIQPRQWLITDDALRIIQLCGVSEAVSCEVEQLIPFDPATDPALQRQTYLRSRTINEDRLAGGLGKLTIDGVPEEDGGVPDPKGDKLLIEAGQQAQPEETDETDPQDRNNA